MPPRGTILVLIRVSFPCSTALRALHRRVKRKTDAHVAFYTGLYPAEANLRGAHLHKAHLHKAQLHIAQLHIANLREADLSMAQLVETNLTTANLTGCHIYGVSA